MGRRDQERRHQDRLAGCTRWNTRPNSGTSATRPCCTCSEGNEPVIRRIAEAQADQADLLKPRALALDELAHLSLDHPRRGLCFSLLGRRSQRHTEFRCLLICSSHAPLQSASDYRGLCLLSCEGFECTDVLFCPIPPLHRLLCHLFAPSKPAAQSALHVEQKCLMIGD